MKAYKFLPVLVVIAFIAFSFQGCQTLQNISKTLTDLNKLQFKLDRVDNFRLAGIGLSSKSKLSDFSIPDGLRLTQAFATKNLLADFVLNVAVKNPNDGTNGKNQTIATLTRLDWRLIIDDVQTISGVINNSVDIPGSGQTTYIPVGISIDLFQFFGNKGYDKIINLALALGGVSSSPSRIKLDIMPTVSTPLGPIQYPNRIVVVDKEFKAN